jgi:hypothetical protein
MQNVENSAGFAFFILHLSFRVPFFITLLMALHDCGGLANRVRYAPITITAATDLRSARVWRTRETRMADQVVANQARILNNQTRVLANQKKLDRVIENQREIQANQKTILANQKKLDQVLANQKTIAANQVRILANQARILAARAGTPRRARRGTS